MHRDGAISRKERELPRASLSVDDLKAARPALALRVVEFAQIEHMALHDALARAAHAFDNAPVAMLLAVFDPGMTFQPHDGWRN
jgi:hypothetical protein